MLVSLALHTHELHLVMYHQGNSLLYYVRDRRLQSRTCGSIPVLPYAGTDREQFNLFTLYILSALYLLPIGRIADLVPLCVVAFKVALAFLGPMHHASARSVSATFECLSVDTNVLLAGMSTGALSSQLLTSLIDLLLPCSCTFTLEYNLDCRSKTSDEIELNKT